MITDRRDQEFRENQEGRRHGTREDFHRGLIGESTFRVSMAALGLTADEIHALVQEHRPFRTIGQVATGFVSGLQEDRR